MPVGYCVVTNDLRRYEASQDREAALERWNEEGRPECPWDGDPEAMRYQCRRCSLKVCQIGRRG